MESWLKALTAAALLLGAPASSRAEPLPGTAPLDWEGDIASRLVDTEDFERL